MIHKQDVVSRGVHNLNHDKPNISSLVDPVLLYGILDRRCVHCYRANFDGKGYSRLFSCGDGATQTPTVDYRFSWILYLSERSACMTYPKGFDDECEGNQKERAYLRAPSEVILFDLRVG